VKAVITRSVRPASGRSAWRASRGKPRPLPGHCDSDYLAIATATLIGILINFSPINPIKALYWSVVPRPMKIRIIA
jgi:hypothetical protein